MIGIAPIVKDIYNKDTKSQSKEKFIKSKIATGREIARKVDAPIPWD